MEEARGPVSSAMSPSQAFVFTRTYSQWLEGQGRRESWDEAVARYFGFFEERFRARVPGHVWSRARAMVGSMGTMPSMRCLWAAGPLLATNHTRAYNCCALAFKDLDSPVELFHILLCGAGVGFSVEHKYIDQMPAVKPATDAKPVEHEVADTLEGWPESLRVGLRAWFAGGDVKFDYAKVRPRGVRAPDLGGRAAGAEPLKRLHTFARNIVLGARGRKLTAIEWLDVGNMIGDVVLLGGARRSSQITFSDLDDEAMRHAKDWPFPKHRAMSNNSAVYDGTPSQLTFLREWTSLATSGSGERGIFNLAAARTASARREVSDDLRTNPCGEILLRADSGQFCNLTEVVVRAGDVLVDLEEKTKIACWLGAIQACLTDFPFIRPSFREACERERLLGVSLTGQMDNPGVLSVENLRRLKAIALAETATACSTLGIPMSAAVTAGKPSGTVSQLVDCASGAHPRYAPYYIRRYRISGSDPLFHLMRAQGVTFSPENGQGPADVARRRAELVAQGHSAEGAAAFVEDWREADVDTWVAEFPEKAPDGAITRDDVSAIDQLEHYLKLKQAWCEHNQSMTVYVREDEWLKVGTWVHEHFDQIVGITFLPHDGGNYQQAPYQAIDRAEYEARKARFPALDYARIGPYEEQGDLGVAGASYACHGDSCELG